MNWVYEDYRFNNFVAFLYGTELYATQDPSGAWFLWNTPAPPKFRTSVVDETRKEWYYSGMKEGGKHMLVCIGTPVSEEVAAASLLIISL